ncbi:MAG: BON domain-containing protein [Gemmataceae bacterium]|nr:BON domain-containing protein [Gemmata sp.]MDW8198711.1 BON domain-containing protein [Gemmataceae bacterium]
MPTSSANAATISDVTLATAILAALDADPVLKDVNVVVSVVDRSVVLGGPVANESLKKRLEELVRAVPGIASVRNTCFVHSEPDRLLRAVATRLKPDATASEPAPLPGVALAPTAAPGYLPPPSPLVVTDTIAETTTPQTVVVQKPALPPGLVGGVLGAPVVPHPTTGPRSPSAPPAPGSLTSTPPSRPAEVAATVQALRQANPRFAHLTVEAQPDGGLFIRGWSAKPADVWDFAAELRKIPGVTHIAVDPELVK